MSEQEESGAGGRGIQEERRGRQRRRWNAGSSNPSKDFSNETCFGRRDFLWKLEMGLSCAFWDDKGVK